MLFASPDLANKIAQLASLAESGEKFAIALTGLLATGVGGAFLAWRKVRAQLKSVEEKVEPVKAEITQEGPNNLKAQVTEIVQQIDNERRMREHQHHSNTDKLQMIEESIAAMRDELADLRRIAHQVLAKMAGLTQ